MGFATTQLMRSLAGWTDKVTDGLLEVHLLSAAREFRTWIGADAATLIETAYEDEETENWDAAAEAEACLAIAYALPSLNTFAMSDGPTMPKMSEDIGVAFLTPDQVEKAQQMWTTRAERVYRGWTWPTLDSDGEETTRTPMGMHAI